jgi:hypothetical protein
MKTAFRIALILFLVAGSMFTGVLLQAAADAKVEAHRANEPISVIGFAVCNQWTGAAVVTGDGIVHGSTDITPEQATAIAKGLPVHHSMLATGPCLASE